MREMNTGREIKVEMEGVVVEEEEEGGDITDPPPTPPAVGVTHTSAVLFSTRAGTGKPWDPNLHPAPTAARVAPVPPAADAAGMVVVVFVVP